MLSIPAILISLHGARAVLDQRVYIVILKCLFEQGNTSINSQYYIRLISQMI